MEKFGKEHLISFGGRDNRNSGNDFK